MHMQIRTRPARSPANIVEFLTVLADNNINIESSGGWDIEGEGRFTFAVAHGDEDHAMTVLRDAGYAPDLVEVATRALDNTPGQLLAFITEVSEQNLVSGRAIRDITVGVPDANGRIQVQVYSL